MSTYTLIQSQTLASSAASVTFSSIPATYTDLVIRASVRGDVSALLGAMKINFNGDTATNYSYTNLLGNSSAASSSYASAQTTDSIINIDDATATASTFGSFEVYIPNYTSTSSKPFSGFDVTENNAATAGAADIQVNAHLYRGASAISSIVFAPSSGNFVTGSSFYLYGISNA
jgi:hypothetical protein